MNDLFILPDERVNSFHEGQEWESPRGTRYRVVARNGMLVWLQDLASGRKQRRHWDHVLNWCVCSDPLYPQFKPAASASSHG